MTECQKCGGRRLVAVDAPAPVRITPGGREAPYGQSYAPCTACRPVVIGKPTNEDISRANNPRGDNLRARALTWIQTHMDAALEMLRYAQDLAAAGQHFGIGLIYEHFRYEAMKRRWKQGEYLLNNNYRAYVARWMIEQDPGLEKFLVFRKTQW